MIFSISGVVFISLFLSPEFLPDIKQRSRFIFSYTDVQLAFQHSLKTQYLPICVLSIAAEAHVTMYYL